MAESNIRTVDAGKLRECVEGIFLYPDLGGLSGLDAKTVTDTLIEADLRGVHSHGVMRVETYINAIAKGDIKRNPNIEIVADLGSRALMDGDRGMGQVSAYRAMTLAIERAKEHGVATVGLRKSRHCGAMAYFAMMALPHDMVGFATTNAGINMAPTGGKTKLVGNNPFAIAIPTNREWPMVLDMATSVAAGGKLDVAISKGEKIPLGWALDKDGKPTDNPIVARQGSLIPVGGPKGYGMAVMLDVLCGVLAGGRFGAGLGAPGSSQFFMAIKIEGISPVSEFKARMDELIDQLHACEPTDLGGRVYVPGEIEWNNTQHRLKHGVPIPVTILNQLEDYAKQAGLVSRPSTW